jgi:serine/threonine-protein kinase
MAVERFRRQAQVAARIRHPNVVQVYDFGVSTEGAVFIVEELLSGRTLRDVVREQRGLTLNRIVGIMNQVCGAVHAAHINGIVLRDVRPDSIFVDQGPDGRETIKVGGFGLAKIIGGPSGGVTMAAAAKVYGRPEYMSP